jgi:hypothetical protein
MIKIFTLALDLLQLPFHEKHLLLAQKLIDKPDVMMFSFCDTWFIFFAFQDLLLGKISQEEFVAFGDSFWKLYEYQNNPILVKEALVYWLTNKPQQYQNSYIILNKKDQLSIEKSLPWLDTLLKKIKSQIFYI